MVRSFKKYKGKFMVKVGLEAIRGVKSLKKIAKEFKVQIEDVITWKNELIDSLPAELERRESMKKSIYNIWMGTFNIIAFKTVVCHSLIL